MFIINRCRIAIYMLFADMLSVCEMVVAGFGVSMLLVMQFILFFKLKK